MDRKTKHAVKWIKLRRTNEERLKTKRRLIDALGGKCVDCGYKEHLAALDFDHKDPTTKAFALSRGIVALDYVALIEEARKCEVRCANCHRIKTFPEASDQFIKETDGISKQD